MGGAQRVIRAVTAFLLPRDGREFILGDLDEMYAVRARRIGPTRASRLYVREAAASVLGRRFRPPRRRGTRDGERRPPMATGILADFRTAVRTLRREPGLVGLVMFTLALGVGSTAAVFGMVNELLLRPLPGVDATVHASYLRLHGADRQGLGLPTPDFDTVRREASLLDGLGSYGRTTLTLARDDERPIAVLANTIYGDFFDVLGTRVAEGRLLTAEETALHADPLVAVISADLRGRLFPPGEPATGRTMMLNGHSVLIVGVAGAGFVGPERGDQVDLWIPFGAIVPLLGFPTDRLLSLESTMHDELVSRIRDGVAPVAAEGELAAVLSRMAARSAPNGDYLAGLRPELYPGLHLPPLWREGTYASLRVLGGVVFIVLLIACANVANLLLVRNVRRRGMVATRRALGASSGRIAREGLAESVLLASLGTLAGLGTGWLIALPFRGERLVRMPAFDGFALDGRVLLFAGAAAAITGVLFGTVPAVLAGRFDLGGALRSAGSRETGRLASVRAALSAGQIALSIALLIGGLLLTRTVRNLYAVDTGLDIENVLTLPIDVPRDVGDGLDALQRDLIARVSALPGVERVALDLYGPHGPRMLGRASLPGAPREERLAATMFPVTPGWFEMFDARVLHGRTFETADWRPGSPGRVIVTASLARRLLGTDDVVGRRIHAGFGPDEESEIIGVLDDVRMAYAADEPHDAFFVTYDRMPPFPMMMLLVRTGRRDASLEREIRTVVEGLLPHTPVPDPGHLTDRVDSIHSERRLFSRLLGLLSALAVLLAAVGLYGVISTAVASRRREFGIRLALGARSRRIAVLVVRHAAVVIGAGVTVGLAAAYALSRLLESRLFGIAPTDLATYGAAALLFAAVSIIACWVPVRSATRVDPVKTLREQ